MLKVKENLSQLVTQAAKDAGFDCDKVVIERPGDINRADFSSMIAFQIAKKEGVSPKAVAEKIANCLKDDSIVSDISVSDKGFLNFFVSDDVFARNVKDVLNDNISIKSEYSGKKILFEHSSPNLFKPFHIGHLVNNTYGSALAHMLKSSGAKVTEISFPSDVSPGIAKAVWGLKKLNLKDDFTIEDLGRAYAEGVRAYDENVEIRRCIDEINRKIYTSEDSEEFRIYLKGKELSLRFFADSVKKLGSGIQDMIFESEAEKVGKDLVIDNTPEIFDLSEGAYIFRGEEKCGLFDNVFVNSQGFGTYLAKDLGLLKIKFDRFDFDLSFTITDIEQKRHFELLRCAAGFVNPKWREKSIYLQHGRMAPKNGKFSSRFGNVPLSDDVIKETTLHVIERIKKGGKGDEKDAEKIALAALKYGILKVTMGKPIVWDKDKALSFEGDSGPYLLYSMTRANSVLSKCDCTFENLDLDILKKNEVVKLALMLDEVTMDAINNMAPHKIMHYANQLASAFNSFYAQNKIADNNTNLTVTRIFLNALNEIFEITGLPKVNKM